MFEGTILGNLDESQLIENSKQDDKDGPVAEEQGNVAEAEDALKEEPVQDSNEVETTPTKVGLAVCWSFILFHFKPVLG